MPQIFQTVKLTPTKGAHADLRADDYLQTLAAVLGSIIGRTMRGPCQWTPQGREISGLGGDMSFKDNLLKKIEIDTLTHTVIHSLGPAESGRKVDKDAMRRLLEYAGYNHKSEREMDIYVKDPQVEKGPILVLDNDLTIYDTTVEDAVMRKNPLIKEMVSIRKIIKILNDKDVVVSRKEDSVKKIQKECLEDLDLTYSEQDIAEITRDGIASLHSAYAEGVKEALAMFAEILGFDPPPKPFDARHHVIYGALSTKDSGEILYGPIALYSLANNEMMLIDEPVGSFDREKMETYRNIVAGSEAAPLKGDDAFYFLKERVLKQKPTL
jgi:hypothetical protein